MSKVIMNFMPRTDKVESSRKGVFWGWYVVFGAFIMLALNFGARYSFGVFVKPMSEEFGWSISVISLAATLSLFMEAIGGIIGGRLLDFMAPRWIMTVGVLVSAIGFWGVSVANNPAQLYLYYGILCGLGGTCLGFVVCSVSVGKWFMHKRGTALGIATMGINFGTLLMATMAGLVVRKFNWHAGFLAIGGMVFVVGILVSQTLMRKSTPEEYGLHTDGESPQQPLQDLTYEEVFRDMPAIWAIVKDSRFWILVYCLSTASMVSMMMLVHQVPYALILGIDGMSASLSLGILGIFGMFGRFFFGWLSDRMQDPKYAAQIGIAIMVLGLIILKQAQLLIEFYLYAIFLGFGYGSLATLGPVLLTHSFGRHVLGTILGVFSFFWVGISALGPFIGGCIYDMEGSYDSILLINIALLVGTIAVLFFLKKESL